MKRYFLINAKYKYHSPSSHLVEANNKEQALSIAKRHKLCYGKNIHHLVSHELIYEVFKNTTLFKKRANHAGGKIWYEENGELKHYPIGIDFEL